MEFNAQQPIWLQIYDLICLRIATAEWPEQERIPSVRELGIELQVNPNTVSRSYEKLQNEEILFNRRGVGYFVAPDARRRTVEAQQRTFLREGLPEIFRKMEHLGLNINDINRMYELYKKQKDENK